MSNWVIVRDRDRVRDMLGFGLGIDMRLVLGFGLRMG